jgi:hypothetical protein
VPSLIPLGRLPPACWQRGQTPKGLCTYPSAQKGIVAQARGGIAKRAGSSTRDLACQEGDDSAPPRLLRELTADGAGGGSHRVDVDVVS